MRYSSRKMHDRRWNKLWYFFIIMAVGLSYSWTKVGSRYEEKKEAVDERDYFLLRTEKNCDLEKAPCAAFAPDYAIVVNLKKNKGWYTLQVKSAGETLSQQSRIKLSFEPESSLFETEQLPVRFQPPDIWYSDVQLPNNDKTIWKFRVQIDRDDHVLVADYPL